METSNNGVRVNSISNDNSENRQLLKETRLLRDTLDLLWNKTLEQKQVCEQLEQENEYLQDYINNLMASSNVLDK
ncbi:hypothetical protein Kpol_1052p37 [Vanderwaltozyma polyspora DSM 70294]|uniref:Uncharacterized protein n=1 Tax=Vanderwaltozyma polyspora (strain ATCC 22028 / DSM 70294 / BCRC 21397 / CBS 2163 / NBRC 10782 / NRRL Y-8283 / UCD 57-17) TaxID=436907 RepID=A7TM47_VANPO|nr:uncharacterized protein Kpol_1052p37 [Vanderwaltozyma polyspora DSM 70294]EDO16689.1 hypothetical protein Kpol_1052p37 [Vanderwaltozyma polyspora DSM 70294]